MSEMQRLFSELPAFAGYGEQTKLLEIFPVRYKPGLHCVIRYSLQRLAAQKRAAASHSYQSPGTTTADGRRL